MRCGEPTTQERPGECDMPHSGSARVLAAGGPRNPYGDRPSTDTCIEISAGAGPDSELSLGAWGVVDAQQPTAGTRNPAIGTGAYLPYPS